MSPKLLKDEDREFVQDALIKFYTERPNYYGFCDTRDDEYKLYAEFICKYANTGNHLDFGTGTFRIAKELSNYNFEKVFGIDFFSEEDKVKLNSELEKIENASIVNYKESNKIPFEDNYFNSISSLCVFEHLVYPEQTLNEMDRVLNKNGFLIIDCPNWSGPNPAITGLVKNIKGKRFWRYNNIFDSIFAIFRSIYWYFLNLLSKKGKFIMIYPRMKDNQIDFEFSDDDVVHLCQPISIIKYMKSMNYELVYCNNKTGRTSYSKLFNKFFPMLATSNQIVLQKK